MEYTMSQTELRLNRTVLNGLELVGLERFVLNSENMQETVILPYGIESIGPKAMRSLKCERLVMPATLTTIMGRAFFQSSIDAVDFSQCKLKSIEWEAFAECRTRAEATLPDTVEFLGDKAVISLKLTNGNRLTLPKSLGHIGVLSVDLNGIRFLVVEENMMTRESGLKDLILYARNYENLMNLLVKRDGKLIYRLQFSFWKGEYHYTDQFFHENPKDYYDYDDWFNSTLDKRLKATIAAFRIMFPEGLTEGDIKAYREYVDVNFADLMHGVEDDLEIIKLYDEDDIISPDHLMQLFEIASQKNDVELVATILDMINRKGVTTAKSLHL
ncbi:MAG: leucine-rich repeat domain-containing protein [Clostridiales bacterium]|jgi:hypothetical protein|nr:leucine-rich repeat domain-containing protein [Clostridiales bacterium]